jgi:hypothetical protein
VQKNGKQEPCWAASWLALFAERRWGEKKRFDLVRASWTESFLFGLSAEVGK